MEAKEKAIELVDVMLHSDIMNMTEYCAKQCALIAVNELLEECRLERDWYWDRVKEEIEKL